MSNINNHGVSMKGKMAVMLAGTMLAITGATLPASATVSSTAQQKIGGQQTLLLAAKESTVQGGHHTDKSPSKKQKHEKGEARRHQDQNVNPAFKDYKKHGGKLSKDAWEKAGRPKR